MFILGGLFDISDQMLGENVKPETVFRRCVETINSLDILPNSTLSTQIERVPATDPFHTGKRGMREKRERLEMEIKIFLVSACHLLKSGVAAIFGPQSG